MIFFYIEYVYMGCFQSKAMLEIHNTAFDLVDSDGDNKLSKKELETIANLIHTYHVEKSRLNHELLRITKPVDYIFELVGKSKDRKLVRRDFNKFVKGIPGHIWKEKILPVLKEKEIARLARS